MKNRKFKERQRYGVEAIGLMIILIAVTVYRFVEQIILEVPASESDILIYVAFMALLGTGLYYLLSTQMVTSITPERIKYRLTSWKGRSKKIKWEDVKGYSVIQMSAAAELSGWGVHFNQADEMVRLYGGSGLLLELKNGEELFIGTHMPEELEAFLQQMSAPVSTASTNDANERKDHRAPSEGMPSA